MNVKIPVGLGCLAECRFSTSTSTPTPHPSALLFTSLVIESSQVEWSATQAQASLCLAREQHHNRLVLLVLPHHDHPLLEPFISRLEQSNALRSRTSSSYASVEISRRARYYFTALVWRKVRFRLSVHSCLPLPFFSRAPLRASAALKRRISTFENPNLRPSTPLKKRPLRLSPSSEKESIRSCLNIAPSLLANLPSLETSIVALKAQPSKRNIFSRPSLPLSGLPSVTERESCRISVCKHY